LIPIVGIVAACAALGVSRASYYRAQEPAPAPKPRRIRPTVTICRGREWLW
jgi:predicted DNA-binding transcriptional regulator AlpA